MILYEVSGSQMDCQFYRYLRDARKVFEKAKATISGGADYVELCKVGVEISAERQLELLNGYWANARQEIAHLDSDAGSETTTPSA